MEKSDLPHDFGVVSMARDDNPDSAGCQFFICLSREGTQHLDGSYCAFGYVVRGRDSILSIAEAELADLATHRPAEPPRVLEVELVDAPPRRPGAGRPDGRVDRELAEEEKPPSRIPR
jgi:peptidyl-prolyl cis-trans isomerase B (cyclophilin B)